MKKALTLIWLLISAVVQAQPPAIPSVPPRVDFAGISVQLDESARQIIQQDINALYTNRQYWNAKLDRVVLYFPIIEAILSDEDVPTDFKYLAVQESSLTPDATSSSQAVGFWQFKRETALMNGMRVDDEIDERKSITGSTRGAATYLKKSNARFNNWVSSLYSYYLGATGVSKLIPADWSYAKEISLDGNTDRYVLRFLAHKIAVENALPSYQSKNVVALVEYPSGGGKTVQQIVTDLGAQGVQVNSDDLLTYNRWILGGSIPADKAYMVMIPVPSNQINDVRQRVASVSGKKTPDFMQNDVGFPVLKKVTLGVRSQADPILYEINGLPGIQAQSGDDAGGLARKARISYSSFLRYNDMSETMRVVPGEVYYLAKKRKKALVPFHTTREGENTRTISQRYGIRLKKLLRYNRIDRVQKLQVGRVMWLRERRPRNRPVEIINVPTPPVYDTSPATPSTRPDRRTAEVAQAQGGSDEGTMVPSRPVNSDNIPRNPSERKRYTPKFGGEEVPATTTTPDRPASMPSASTPPATPPDRSRPVPTEREVVTAPSAPVSRPTRSNTPPATTGSSNGTTRTVTVKPANPVSEPAEDDDLLPSVPTKSAKQGGYEVTGNEPIPSSTSTPAPARTTTPTRLPSSSTPVVVKPSTPVSEPVAAAPKPSAPVRTEPVPAPSRPATAAGKRTMTHTVEAGQTYYSISKQYGVIIDDVLTANNLTLGDKLSVGQQLTIRNVPTGFPVGREVSPSVAAPSTTGAAAPTGPAKPEVIYHTVEKGQTMFRISKLYNVTIEQIQGWNGLTDVTVKQGQKIKIIK